MFSSRPLSAEVLVQSQNSSCGVCGGQSDTGTGFFFDFAVSVLFHQCSTLRVISIISEAQAVEA